MSTKNEITNTEYFIIAQKENDLFENKGMVDLILGKYETVDKIEDDKVVETFKRYRVYCLKVNEQVNINFYFKLLKENDFNDLDFKEISFDDIKDKIKNEYVTCSLFDKHNKLYEYIQ